MNNAVIVLWIICGFIAIGGFLYLCIFKINSKKKVGDLWVERNTRRRQFITKFDAECVDEQFLSSKKIVIQAYYHTENLVDIFGMKFDFQNKRLAMCSFESEEYESYFIQFDDIASFEILNGIASSSSQSFGSASTFAGISAGSADTYVTNKIGNIRLKIEIKNRFGSPIIVPLFRYNVDTGDDVYRKLLDSIEDIKTSLNWIVGHNKEQD